MKVAITNEKGFHVRMANGIVLSVQIGAGNYCDNRNEPFRFERKPNYVLPASENAEIAIWMDGEGDILDLPSGDTVAGYVSIESIFAAIPAMAALKNPTPDDIFKAMGDGFFDG
jgi:hypothetical protein